MAANIVLGELEEVPFGAMLEALARDVVKAQHELDLMGIRMAQVFSGAYRDPEGDELIDTRIDFDGRRASLLEIGFRPNFYHFVDSVLEVKVSIEMTSERSAGGSRSKSVETSAKVKAVSARFANRFQYHAEGASSIRTRLATTPPPGALEGYMHELLAESAARNDAESTVEPL